MMESLGHSLNAAAPALLELFVRGALLLSVAAVAAWLWRGASASVRHLVWASALWALLVLPVASQFVPEVAVRILPSRAAQEASAAKELSTPVVTADPAPLPPDAAGAVDVIEDRATVDPPRFANAPAAAPLEIESSAGVADTSWSWRGAAVAVWAIVALALLAEMGRSRLRLRRLAGSAWRIHDPAWWRAAARIGHALGLRRSVLLLATTQTRVPLTWGTREPIVLLPADASRWSAERREAVLVHELAHVARGDARGHDIARVAAALFWANPLVWIALRMMRAERERACDDLVLSTGTRASSYAGDLLQIALTLGGRTEVSAAALAMARPSELEGRLLAILDPRIPRRPAGRAARVGAGVLALMLLVPLASLRPAERPAGNRQAVAAERPSVVVMSEAGHEVGDLESSVLDSGFRRNDESGAPPRATQPDAGLRRNDGSRAPSQESQLDADSDWNYGSGVASSAFRLDAGVRRNDEDTLPSRTLQPDTVASQEVVSPAAPSTADAPTREAPITGVARQGDLETLIAVARAAAGLSSDNDKAELLLAVLARGMRNDSLQSVVLRSASTIRSSYERHRVMLALLRHGMAPGAEARFIAAAEGVSSIHERATVLTAFLGGDQLTDPAVRAAFLRVVASITSTYERTQLLARVTRLPSFDAAAALDLMPAVRALSSSHEKANLLVAMARRGVTSDPAVRDAFVIATSSLSSKGDRERVMRAAGLQDEGRPQ
jgi:beta-lactamase regulating signal transducer with metallopeptidase domain